MLPSMRAGQSLARTSTTAGLGVRRALSRSTVPPASVALGGRSIQMTRQPPRSVGAPSGTAPRSRAVQPKPCGCGSSAVAQASSTVEACAGCECISMLQYNADPTQWNICQDARGICACVQNRDGAEFCVGNAQIEAAVKNGTIDQFSFAKDSRGNMKYCALRNDLRAAASNFVSTSIGVY
jgi:hypothetical protein